MANIFTPQDIEKLQKSNNQAQFSTILFSKNVQQPSIKLFISNIYKHCTKNGYSCNQKQVLINFSLNLIHQIHNINLDKSIFIKQMRYNVNALSKRGKTFNTYFNENQTENIFQYLSKEILPYFEIYQTVLDKSPHFTIQTINYQPVPVAHQNILETGTIVQVDTIEVLKKSIGIRQPKEEKKDPKKK